MTEENYNYRTSQSLLRNQFPGKGKLQIPIIPKFVERLGDFDDLLLIGFDKTHLEDQNHLDVWFISSCMTIALNESGRIRTAISKNSPGTVRYCLRISACIWKWQLLCSFTMYFVIAGAAPIGPPRESVLFPR